MRITQVELNNIKSYRHAVIPLAAGTTAIRGRNGAGKSTLVEAIGYALFDALPYKQAQFVREGERTGTVTVSFLSAFDDREYQVVRRCGSSADWYAFDPMLGTRLVEQKADMLAFLRQHLRIEGEVELSALFGDALGVPQGAFTSDFLLQPAPRKKKFDALLQVEDYRKAAERLLDARNYLQDQRREQQKRIDDLERETSQLAGWRAQREAASVRARELAEHLDRIQREATSVEARRDVLRRQEAEVTRLAAAADVAAATHAAAQVRSGEAEQRATEARTAVAVCQATHGDHQAFVRTEAQLVEARQRARARDALLGERAETAQTLEGARRDAAHAQRLLDEALAAAQRVVALAASVERQNTLEQEKNQAILECQRLEDAERNHRRVLSELEQAAREIATAEQRIAALDALRTEADQLPERRSAFEKLQAQVATRAQQEQRRTALLAEEREATKKREELALRARKAEENVRKIEARREDAERFPALQAEYDDLAGQVRRLEVSLDSARTSRAQSGEGLCPFLSEPCLNIQGKGAASLGSYFDRLISTDELKLTPARRKLQTLQEELEHARTVRSYYERLEDFQERWRQACDDLAATEAQLARLADERARLDESLAAGPTKQQFEAARNFVDASMKATQQRSALPELRETIARAQARQAANREERATLDEHIAALKDAPLRLREAASALQALGDPRKEYMALQRVAAERAPLEAQVRATAAAATQLQGELARLDAALKPYAGLDAELQRLEAELDRTRAGHTRYLQHEHLAATLPERESALATAVAALREALSVHHAAVQAHRAASGTFDAVELARVSARADELGAERGSATEALRHTQAEITRLSEEIARVEQLLGALAAARDELGQLEELEQMLQQFRDTIKEAGPHILKALLRHISQEAKRIFGDIMGDRSAELSWEQDYEIVLRRDGRERSFAQLSGGEQMSAALAVRLALLRNLSRLDFAFFDEPTQNMDGERRGNLAEQIRRVRGFDQLIVISHDDTFEQGLDSVIHLDKRNGETQLVEDEALLPA
jgi:exonuclease SbcC